MKRIFLTFLVIFTTLSFAQSSSKEKQNEIKSQQWNNDFINFLINHDNPDLSMLGLSELLVTAYPSNDGTEAFDTKQFMQSFEDLISHEKLQPKSLLIAADLCTNPKIKQQCPLKKLFTKLINSEPKNLSVYIPIFNQAVFEEDNKKIIQLLHTMSETQYDNSYFTNSEQLLKAFDFYIINSPNLDSVIDNEITQLKKISSRFDETINYMQDNPEAYQIYMKKLNFKLKYPIPPYRAIIDTCKSQQEYYKPCLEIANTMIESNNTLISTFVGYRIQEEVYSMIKNQEQAELSKQRSKQFKNEYECIVEIYREKSYFQGIESDIDYFDLSEKIEREQGEYAAYKALAEIKYKRLLELGLDDVKDPKECFATKPNP